MTLQLRLRTLSAYFTPAQFFIADNESITVRLVDRGTIKEKAYLQLNGCVFAFDDNNELQISADDLHEVNFCELQLRDKKGNITKRWTTENLFRPPIEREVDGEYYETQQALLTSIQTLTQYVEDMKNTLDDTLKVQQNNAQKIAELENGKFTMLRFGGNEE